MSKKITGAKGTRDFYPEQMAVRNWITDAWKQVSVDHGFEEIDGPIFEMLDLFTAKSGQEIVEQLFSFEDRGGRQLAIRPEITPTVARMVNQQAQSLRRPIRWFSVPRLCRSERPQKGRLREFFQWNIDIIGADEMLADAECIFVAIDYVRRVGLKAEDVVMRIGSRALLAALLAKLGYDEDRHAGLFAILDKRDKVPAAVFEEKLAEFESDTTLRSELLKIASARGYEGLELLAEMARGDTTATSHAEDLKLLFIHLHQFGVDHYCEFDSGIVRGLAYYTGPVFEMFYRGGQMRAICGGGRYDNLLKVLGGPQMPAVGFGMGDVIIEDIFREKSLLPTQFRPTTFYVVDADTTLFDRVVNIVAMLRHAGHTAQFSYKRQALGKQLKAADACGARVAVIVGEELIESEQVVTRDLHSGQQRTVSVQDFLADPEHSLHAAS